MSLKKFLTSRIFFLNLIIAIILVIALVALTMQRLKSYTRHGESFPTPNLEGLSLNEVEEIISQSNLNFKVIDSLYAENALPGTVIEQVPNPGFMVKQNRVIFLTIMPVMAEKVTLPKLTDISFRQALGLVESAGLVLGKITYEPSEFNNLVLKVEQDTSEVREGDVVQKGSSLNFVIGTNSRIQDIPVPDLTGMPHLEAEELINSYMLKIGRVHWDVTIVSAEDSMAAFVWKQNPGTHIRFVSMGTSLDMWLTTDTLKLPQPEIIEPLQE